MANFTDEQLKDLASTPLSELSPKGDKAFPGASEQFLKLKTVPISERTYYDIDPLWKWVLCRKIEREVNAFGEGIVGAIDADRSQIGVVVSISEVCVQKKIQVGDRVMFTNYALLLPDIEEATGRKDLLLIREEEIYCRLIEKPRPGPIVRDEGGSVDLVKSGVEATSEAGEGA